MKYRYICLKDTLGFCTGSSYVLDTKEKVFADKNGKNWYALVSDEYEEAIINPQYWDSRLEFLMESQIIKIGDLVTVIAPGKRYSSYRDFFTEHNLSKRWQKIFDKCNSFEEAFPKELIFEVLYIGEHKFCKNNVAVIRNGLKIYLIDVEGLVFYDS